MQAKRCGLSKSGKTAPIKLHQRKLFAASAQLSLSLSSFSQSFLF
jgi:hypothetical protein